MGTRHCRRWLAAIVVPGLVLSAPFPARAQTIELSAVELSIAATFNTLADVNAVPQCLRLALPCTYGRSDRFNGFGVNAGIAHTLSKNVAIAGEVGMFRTGWDIRAPNGLGRASAQLTSLVVGPKLNSGFLLYGPSHGRFFLHVLAGGETHGVDGVRPTLVIGTGADGGLYRAARRAAGGPARPLIIRWSVDYRISPGERRSFSGYRFTVGLLYGPRLLPPK